MGDVAQVITHVLCIFETWAGPPILHGPQQPGCNPVVPEHSPSVVSENEKTRSSFTLLPITSEHHELPTCLNSLNLGICYPLICPVITEHLPSIPAQHSPLSHLCPQPHSPSPILIKVLLWSSGETPGKGWQGQEGASPLCLSTSTAPWLAKLGPSAPQPIHTPAHSALPFLQDV